MEVLTGNLSLTPKDRLQAVKDATVKHLAESPADPESGTSVSRYCYKGIDLFASIISASYAHRFPDRESYLIRKLFEVTNEPESYTLGHNSEEKFVLDGNNIIFERPPHPKSRSTQPTFRLFSGISAKAGYIDRRLPRIDYADMLNQAPPSKDSSIRQFGNPDRGRYQIYSWRYFLFLSQSGLEIKAPEVELLSLVFLEDLAKKKAMGSIRQQLLALEPFSQTSFTTPPDEVDQAVKYIVRKIDPTYYHLGYLDLIKEAEMKVRSGVNFSDDQDQLLRDVAILRKGQLDGGDLTQLLEPISRLIGQGDYLRAAACRDFVLDNFAECAPAWRRKDFGSSRSYHGVSTFAQIRYEQPEPFQGIPEEYSELVSTKFSVFDQKAEKAALVNNEKVEKIRQRVVASKLLFEAIKTVSSRQAKSLGRWRINPDAAISDKNPIILNYRLYTSNLEKIAPTGDHVYTSVIHDADGEITQLQYSQEYQFGFFNTAAHHLTVIFNNLLFQRLLEIEDIDLAFQTLGRQGKITDSDSPQKLLSTSLHNSLRNYLRDASDLGSETALRKAGMIEDLIKSFA